MSIAGKERSTGGRRARRVSQLVAYVLLLVSCENPLGPDVKNVGRVEVVPGTVSLAVGASGSLRADVIGVDGSPLAGRHVFWSSQNTAIASVSQTGTVTGVTPGVVAISANSGGKSGVSNVTITARPVSTVRVTPLSNQLTVGNTVTLSAEALDAGGVAVPGRIFSWSSTNSTVATVSSTGVVTALSPGNATISASVDGVTGSATVTAAAVPVASITIDPDEGTVSVAQNVQLRATPLDAGGNVLNGRLIQWSSSDNDIATVSSTGLVVGLAPGRSTITASSEGKSASALITVTLVPINSISIAPSQATIAAGANVQLTPTAKDVNGNVLNGRSFVWTSDQPTIATVSPNGDVTGVSQGVARVTAEAEGKTAVALVTVTPVAITSIDVAPATASLSISATTQLTATPKDAQGQPLPGRVITWITGAPSVATVSQTGLVTAVGTGSAIIFAASEGISGSASITVSSIAVATVVVTPPTSTITVGGFVQLSAATLDAQSNPLIGRTVQWTSSNQSVAVVSSTGRVQSVSAGTVTITATSEGVSGTATVTTNNVPVASVLVTPPNATMVVGQATTFLATPRDAQGNQLLGRTITWASSNPSVASVNANGDVTAIGPGTAQLSATCELVQGFASITVTSIPVASVNMTPPSASLSSGQTQQMTVTVRDAANNLLSGRTVTFTSSIITAATVSPATTTTNASGQAFATVTAVGSGATTITATSGAVQTTSTITVTAIPISTITVTPGTPTVQEGQTVQLTATARDAGGQILPGRTIVWSSSNPAISVSQAGLVTTIANTATQVTTITASSPGGGPGGTTPFGTAAVTVSYAPVATVSVLPSPAVVTVSGTTSLTLTLKDAANNVLNATGRVIAWTSQNTAIATVSSSGVVTGVATGATTVTVTARSPGQATAVSQVVNISVSNVPVASVTVTPNPATIHVGSPYQAALNAITKDGSGNVLPGRQVVWSSSNASVASVDPLTGVVTGISQGSATITATSEGIPGTASVTVDLVPVSTVVMAPSTATLAPPQTVQLTASPKDSAGNDITGAALGGRSTSWSSSSVASATVSATGLVTAVGIAAANVTITATIGGTDGTMSVTVLAPVASVTLSPFVPADSLIAPNTATGVATVADAATNPLSGRLVTFTSSNPSRASVTVSGTSDAQGHVPFLVSALANASGTITANITASSESQTSLAEPIRILNPVGSVSLTSPTDSLIGTGGTVATATTLRDAFSNTITGRPITYGSTNPAAATVNPTTGLITAVGVGSTTVTATSEGKTSSLTFRVLPPVATVTVTAPTDSIGATQTLQATATLKDASNGTITGRPVTWSSGTPAVATVNPTTGLVTGVAAGNSIITATSEGQNGTFTVRVIPGINAIVLTAATDSLIGPGTIAVTATATDAGSTPIVGRTLTVSSSNPAAATVTPPTGITDGAGTVALTVTNVAPGNSTISATAEGKTGLFVVRMLAPVATVSVTTPGDSIVGSGTLQASTVLKDASNNTLTGRPINYASSNTAVATVDATTGLVTSVAPGSVTITATSEGKTGNAVLRILAPVASVTITAAPAAGDSVLAGSITLQTAVVLRDAANNVLTGRPISYASSNASLATVSATGLVSGVGVTGGAVTISATSEGVTSAAPLSVRVLAPVATITVTAPDSSIDIGNSVTAIAVLKDAANNTLTGRPVNWSSSSVSIATVAQTTGVITAVAPGQISVTAGAEGKTGLIPLFRSLGPVNTVTVTPPAPTIGNLQTVTLTVTVTDAAAFSPNPLDGITCTMDAVNPFIAVPVNGNGSTDTTDASGTLTFQVRGLFNGTTNIRATCNGKVGISSVTVQ